MNIKTLIQIAKSSGDAESIVLGDKLERLFIASKAEKITLSLNPTILLEQLQIQTGPNGEVTWQNTSSYKEMFEKGIFELKKILEDAIYWMENLDKGEEIFPEESK